MTQAQKIAKEKFKKAIAYRKKTGATLKEAFAFVYGRKVSPVKKKAEPKKKAASKKVGFAHKKVGALPIDFKGNFQGYRFKVINQYQLDGGVTAQLVELDGKGNIIAQLSGNSKENDRVVATLLSGATFGGQYKLDEKDKKQLEKRIKSFVVGLNKEVAAYNSGKDTSKKKSKGLKIVYKPETKKLAVVDQIKSILKNNKKILKGGYTLKTGVIREKKVAGFVGRLIIKTFALSELKKMNPIYFEKGKDKNAGVYKRKLIISKKLESQVMVEAQKDPFTNLRSYVVRLINAEGSIGIGKRFDTIYGAAEYIGKNIIL